MGSVQPPKWSHNFLTPITKLQSHSSSLRPVTKVFTCWKWFIGYNFGIDDRTESKFGTHEELIVLNILKYKCCVNNSSDLSRDHFAKICKLLTNWWPVFSKSGGRILYLVHVLYPVRSPCFILPRFAFGVLQNTPAVFYLPYSDYSTKIIMQSDLC